MKKFVFVLIYFSALDFTHAQNLEIGFHSPLPIRPAVVYKILQQPDGKFLVSGDLNFLGTNRVRGLVRLNADGSQDATFNFLVTEDSYIIDIELQSTGDIVCLSQKYNLMNGAYTSEASIYRMDLRGELKNTVTGLTAVNAISVQTDDKILLAGANYLQRFSSDLISENSFNNAVSFDGRVTDVQQFGNSLIVSGTFSTVNGVTKNDLVKLDLNGNVEATFDTGTGTTDYVGSIAVQSDGKILLGNTYINTFNGVQGNGTMRLNADGSVDTSFAPFYFNGPVSRIFLKGTEIYAAAFLDYNSGTNDYLFKLANDGSMDMSFKPVELSPFGAINLAFAAGTDGFIISNSQNSGNVFSVSKFDLSGNKANGFAPEVARFGTFTYGSYFNDKLLVAGDFVRVDGFETFSVVSLNGDGTVNQSFALKTNLGPTVQTQVLSDESVMVSTGPSFVKLNSTGDIQPDFNWSHFGTLYNIEKFEMLNNGKIVVADANNIYRLNADGSEDTSFNIGSGICCAASTAFDFDMQGSKIIYGSVFDHFNNTPVSRIVRLKENAEIDETFNVGSGPDRIPHVEFDYPMVGLVKVLESGDVLAGGYFNYFNGVEVPNNIVKLSQDGALDLAFNENQKSSSGSGEVYLQQNIVKQIGSKIVIGQPDIKSLYVLNLDGTVDSDFNIPIQVGFLNYLIPYNPSSSGGRQIETTSSKVEMFALGSFNKDAQSDRSLLIKMSYDPDNLVTAVEKKQVELVKAYPNPIERKLQLEFLQPSGNYAIEFYDNLGRLMRQTSFNSESNFNEIDFSNDSVGAYVMKIVSDSGKTQIVKLLKK